MSATWPAGRTHWRPRFCGAEQMTRWHDEDCLQDRKGSTIPTLVLYQVSGKTCSAYMPAWGQRGSLVLEGALGCLQLSKPELLDWRPATRHCCWAQRLWRVWNHLLA